MFEIEHNIILAVRIIVKIGFFGLLVIKKIDFDGDDYYGPA